MKVQFKYVFDRRNKCKKPGDFGMIELRVYHDNKATYYSTKISVPLKDWNGEKEPYISNRNREADDLNDTLQALKEKLNIARREAEFKGQPFGHTEVKAAFKTQKSKTNSFKEFATEEIESNNAIKEVTKRSHRNTINKLLAFTGRKDILFSELDYEFFANFINYLTGLINPLTEKKVSPNTVRKHIKNCKAIIEKAINKGYFDRGNPCKKFKLKEVETKSDVLTWEEIQKLEEYAFEAYEHKLETIRNMMLFMIYTGVRVSDITNLKREYVKQTSEGVVLDFFTKKVNKHAIIPLYLLFPLDDKDISRPLRILNKYYSLENEYVFPRYTDQYINRELKNIAALVGIKFNLTSKIGRKSFATLLGRKTSTPTLKRLLQHTSFKTTEKYIHLSDKMVDEDLGKVKWE
ncbi:MAG: site-specific integrase [Bacteroidetes bacterium]|nr:site-specific integrase [Bacteroidota bacterium]